MSLQKNKIYPLTIHAIASDGSGVGRIEGKTVFVPATAVGDVLQVKIVKDLKRHAYGRVHQLVTPGPGRQDIDCPVFPQCGGCTFRHLQYTAELDAKRAFVADALQRIGGLEIEVPAVLPSPLENGYRNKAQYPVCAGPGSELRFGFYAQRSHRIVSFDECRLQPALLNTVARRTAQLLQEQQVDAYNEETQNGTVRHIYLRQGKNDQLMVCIVCTHPFAGAEALAQTLASEYAQVDTVLLNINPQNTNVILGAKNIILQGTGQIEEEICGVPLSLGAHSFSQVNRPGAEQLFGLVGDFAAVTSQGSLLDLYCGAGVIGLSMARTAKTLVGVEIVPEAVESARGSAQKMGLHNTRFICADAGTAAQTLAAEGFCPDVITVDPPRKGCDASTLAALCTFLPSRIVMVSCNPATLARDLAHLTANGYSVTQLQPVDLFPRTRHVECVVLMTKN